VKARRQPADAAVPVKNYLVSCLSVPEPEVTAALNLPPKWAPETHPPAVVVFDDSGPTRWPIATHPQIRVTVWAHGRTRARTIAGLCLGWLLAGRVPGVKISPGTSIIDARDPDNGGDMASFTVRTTVRTVPLPVNP